MIKKRKKVPGLKKSNFSVAAESEMIIESFALKVKDFNSIETEKTENGLLLKRMPVFKAGVHRGIDFSEDFLDKNTIAKFSSDEDVPIQRDHSDEAFKTLGYVKNIFREGNMLFADMELIDDESILRWNKKLMKKWSVSIFGAGPENGKLREISAVAFPFIKEARVHSSGSDLPKFAFAIVPTDKGYSLIHLKNEGAGDSKFKSIMETLITLNPTISLNHSDADEIKSSLKGYTDIFNNIFKINEEGDEKMDLKELQEKFNKFEADSKLEKEQLNKDLATKDKEIETLNASVTSKDKDIADQKFAALKASVETKVDSLISDKRVAPARKDSLVDTLSKMGEDDRKAMLETLGEASVPELNENGTTKSEKDKDNKNGKGKFHFDNKVYDINEMSVEETNSLVDAYADKNKLGFNEAQDVIFDEAKPNAE